MARKLTFLLTAVFAFTSLPLSVQAAPGTYISEINAQDRGSVPESGFDLSIDVQQGLCGDASDLEAEPFFDTYLTATVQNSGSLNARVLRYWYRLPAANGFSAFRSRPLAPSTSASVNAKKSGKVTFLFLKASGGGKLPQGSTTLIPSTYGFQSVDFFFQLRDGVGRRSVRRMRVGLAFGNYDRCD